MRENVFGYMVTGIKTDSIWMPSGQRPYWTTHNKRGNAGPHLTNKELWKHGLIRYKEYKFSEVWYQSYHGRKRSLWKKFIDRFFYWL